MSEWWHGFFGGVAVVLTVQLLFEHARNILALIRHSKAGGASQEDGE